MDYVQRIKEANLADEMMWDLYADKALNDPVWGPAFKDSMDVLEMRYSSTAMEIRECERKGKNYVRNKEYAIKHSGALATEFTVRIFAERWASQNGELFLAEVTHQMGTRITWALMRKWKITRC